MKTVPLICAIRLSIGLHFDNIEKFNFFKKVYFDIRKTNLSVRLQLLFVFLFSYIITMINNPIANKIISTIEKEIYQDFENFIKSVNVQKTDLELFTQKPYLVNYL